MRFVEQLVILFALRPTKHRIVWDRVSDPVVERSSTAFSRRVPAAYNSRFRIHST